MVDGLATDCAMSVEYRRSYALYIYIWLTQSVESININYKNVMLLNNTEKKKQVHTTINTRIYMENKFFYPAGLLQTVTGCHKILFVLVIDYCIGILILGVSATCAIFCKFLTYCSGLHNQSVNDNNSEVFFLSLRVHTHKYNTWLCIRRSSKLIYNAN